MGFGAVIKVLLVFDRVFWWDTLPDAGFIFSDEMIPTWWTQFPDGTPVLTGWLAGPRAEEFFDKSEEELIEMGLTSVSKIWRKSHPELKEYFVRGYAYNWATDPFERGAYMYTTVEEPDAPAVLAGPVEGVLFFAGEATYSGPYVGTVEAALVSGKEAAEKVLRE